MAVISVEAEKARAFARNYVNFVEALLQVGVTDEQAREEARLAALTLLQQADADDKQKGSCPMCGRG